MWSTASFCSAPFFQKDTKGHLFWDQANQVFVNCRSSKQNCLWVPPCSPSGLSGILKMKEFLVAPKPSFSLYGTIKIYAVVTYQQLIKYNLKCLGGSILLVPSTVTWLLAPETLLLYTSDQIPWLQPGREQAAQRPLALHLQNYPFFPARLSNFRYPGRISCWQLLIMLLVDLPIYALFRARSQGKPGKIPFLSPHFSWVPSPWQDLSEEGSNSHPVLQDGQPPVPAWANWTLDCFLSLQTLSFCLWVFLRLPVLWQYLAIFDFHSRAQIHWLAPDPPPF